MKPEQEELIAVMVKALLDSAYANDASMPVAMRDALRAAAERGYVLAKLPGRRASEGGIHHYSTDGWNECLGEIETVRVDE